MLFRKPWARVQQSQCAVYLNKWMYPLEQHMPPLEPLELQNCRCTVTFWTHCISLARNLYFIIINGLRWSPRGRPWPRGRPRGNILKFLAMASKPQVLSLGPGLEASSPQKLPCARLEDSTIFWTVEVLLENARNLAENLQTSFFVFLNWSIGVGKGRRGRPPLKCNFTNDKNVTKKSIVPSVSF